MTDAIESALAEIEERHQKDNYSDDCLEGGGTPWPCDAVRLVAAVREARELAQGIYGAGGCDEWDAAILSALKGSK